MAKYGIKNGQIYIAADGSKSGVVVIDAETYSDADDVLVRRLPHTGVHEDFKIDVFKLAMVRYRLVDIAPDWM